MTKDDIIKLGESTEHILRKKAMTINNMKDHGGYWHVLNDMAEFVGNKENGAFGLAMPQIGISARAYVCRFLDKVEIFINPKITLRGHKKLGQEACLSEPGVEKVVLRNEAITVKYTDINGELKELKLAGLYARIVQHEQDHLDGILLVDK